MKTPTKMNVRGIVIFILKQSKHSLTHAQSKQTFTERFQNMYIKLCGGALLTHG